MFRYFIGVGLRLLTTLTFLSNDLYYIIFSRYRSCYKLLVFIYSLCFFSETNTQDDSLVTDYPQGDRNRAENSSPCVVYNEAIVTDEYPYAFCHGQEVGGYGCYNNYYKRKKLKQPRGTCRSILKKIVRIVVYIHCKRHSCNVLEKYKLTL